MFDALLNRIRRMEAGVRISVPIALDDEGYYDRVCPSDECGAEFKVLFEDWRNIVRDDVVFCPTCRFEAPATDWHTSTQRAQIREAGLAYARGQIQTGTEESARAFNRRQPRDGFITMRMSYRPAAQPVVIPARAAALLQQRWSCERCECRYASLGAAFFCPSCGHNSAIATFDHTVATVRASLDAIPQIGAVLERGAAADMTRRIVEDGFVKLVGTFQRFAEATHAGLSNVATPRRNVFQTFGEASALWRGALGLGYDELLSVAQVRDFTRFLQQRHVLVHSDGIVDQDYLDRSGDATYRSGQRIVVRVEDVRALADLLADLAQRLRLAIAQA